LLRFYIFFIFILFYGCSTHTPHQGKALEDNKTLLDLEKISQSPSFYTKDVKKKHLDIDLFAKNYFRVWNQERISASMKDAMWAHDRFRYGDSYGENLQLLPQEFFTKSLENANFEAFATLNKRAVSLKLLNMRAYPTGTPLFKDPKKAGEGFPFDYLQNSTVAANKPLLVSHYSKDRAWVFVESSFGFGWVKADDIVFLDKKYTDIWQKAEQIFLLSDTSALYSQKGEFLFKTRVGMVLPLISEDAQSYTVLVITKGSGSKPLYLQSRVSKEEAYKGVLTFQAENIDRVINELLKAKYGWGGMYEQRDCSSTLRDFYTPFGLWLPRNSSRQAEQGRVISLENLNNDEKIEKIKKSAIPFETFLYKQGHIVLYAGVMDGDIIVFQNVWGVKTMLDGEEGRYVVGKTIFSTLELGKELATYDEKASLLSNLKSLNLLVE